MRAAFHFALLILALLLMSGSAQAAQVSAGGGGGAGYTCDTGDFDGDKFPGERSCKCSGSASGTDCQAMIAEVCKKTGSGPSKSADLLCEEGAGGAAVDCHCAWASGIIAPNNITGEAAASGAVLELPQAADGFKLCLPEDPDWPGCVFTGLGTDAGMAPKDALPIVQACLAAGDQRTRISQPNATQLQCCSAELGYCVECPQDMQGACGVGPFVTSWAHRIDGIMPEIVAPTSSSGKHSSGAPPIIID